MRPSDLTYGEASRLLDDRELSSVDLCTSIMDRIDEVDGSVRAYLSLRDRRGVLEDAGRVDEARAHGGSPGPLAGIPVAVKDNIAATGLPTTAGSMILEGYRSPYDATAVARLKAAGAVVIGKTNLDEFGMGSSCENSAYGPTRNPWDLGRVPGGSSGGSAAAVASGMCTLALGTDTGGSVRQPAGFCGIVGMLPSYGAVSRYGLVAFASSLDQIGPLSRDVAGAAALLRAIAGRDAHDATSTRVDLMATGRPSLAGVRLGLPRECLDSRLDDAVREAFLHALETARGEGAAVVEVSLRLLRFALPAYHVVADAEASANLARYDGVAYGRRAEGPADIRSLYEETRGIGFGAEVKRRVMLGTFALSEGYHDRYYARAQRVRVAIAADLSRALEEVDLLVTPTSPTTAFPLGERVDEPVRMYEADIYTTIANLASVPAISLPCGRDGLGLPIGLQLVGRRLGDARLLQVAEALEAAMAAGTGEH